MNEYIANLTFLAGHKEEIIADVRKLTDVEGYNTSQAQKLREYSTRTQSVKDLILYIDYQCARSDKPKFLSASKQLKEYIEGYEKKYSPYSIEAIRNLLGAFAWLVVISEDKKKKEKGEKHAGK